MALLAIVVLALPITAVRAEEEPAPAEMTEAERLEARRRAKELSARVFQLFKQRRPAEALPLAREALELRERLWGPDHPDVAYSLVNLCAQLYALKRYDETKPLYERAIGIYERAYGPAYRRLAGPLHGLARAHEASGRHHLAVELYQRALGILEEERGVDHPHVAACLCQLGNAYRALGHSDRARACFDRALDIQEAKLDAAHPKLGDTLVHYSEFLRSEGEYREAATHLERAIEIWRKVLRPGDPIVGAYLSTLAWLLVQQCRYEEAQPCYEEALAIREKALGPDHPDVATTLVGKAFLLRGMGRFTEARALYQRAVGILEKGHGREHPKTAATLARLAQHLTEEARFEEARPLHERAVAILERELGRDHPGVVSSLLGLAVLLRATGQYAQAKLLCERALAIREKALGPDALCVASVLHELAIVEQYSDRQEQARLLFERALAIRGQALGDDHLREAVLLRDYGMLLERLGEFEAARAQHERAVRIQEAAFGADHPLVAASLDGLGQLLLAEGHHDEAKVLFQRVLALLRKGLGDDHLYVARAHNNLGMTCRAAGDLEGARTHLQQAMTTRERQLRLSFMEMQSAERRAMAQSLRKYLDNWIRLASDLGVSGHAEVLRFKGLATRVDAVERRLSRRGNEEVCLCLERVRAADRRLSALASAMPRVGDRARHEAWQEEYARAGARREDAARELARASAVLRRDQQRLDVDLEDVCSRLEPNEALADFVRSGERYVVWITRSSGDVARVDLGDATVIDDVARRFVGAVAADVDGSRGPLVPAPHRASAVVGDAGRELSRMLLEPLEARWGDGVETIYLCPDGSLAAVPFAALPGRAKGRYLIDDYLIVQLSMAQDLVPWTDHASPGRGCIAVGDVSFDGPVEGRLGATPDTTVRVGAMARAPRASTFLPLPETREEVKFVRGLFGDASVALAGVEATEASVRRLTRGKRFVHLATHGFVRDDLTRGLSRQSHDATWLGADLERQLAAGYDPMLLAGLALAGANPRDGGHGDDGILTAAEASYLHLDGVDLVVLSACQTALGRAEAGEGVIGLVRGFQMAGAERVIASLWRVDDEATRLLMQYLYAGMLRAEDPLPPAEALREAALKVRSASGRSGRSFAAPRYWAAFVAYGR